jgi:hypothetical protein
MMNACFVYGEEMMKSGGTPDTIPSLGTLSPESTDTEGVTRVLFGRPGQKTPSSPYGLDWPSADSDTEKFKSPASDIAVASVSIAGEHHDDLDIDMNSDFYEDLLLVEEEILYQTNSRSSKAKSPW